MIKPEEPYPQAVSWVSCEHCGRRLMTVIEADYYGGRKIEYHRRVCVRYKSRWARWFETHTDVLFAKVARGTRYDPVSGTIRKGWN